MADEFISHSSESEVYNNKEDSFPSTGGNECEDKRKTEKITYQSGDVYEGEIENGIRNGIGTCVRANGDVYDGEWQNNKKNGKGKITFAEGYIYEGEFKDGKYLGLGKMTYFI